MMPQCSSPPSAWWPATSASATTSRRASVSNCWACLTTRRPRWRRDQGRGLARVPEPLSLHRLLILLVLLRLSAEYAARAARRWFARRLAAGAIEGGTDDDRRNREGPTPRNLAEKRKAQQQIGRV